VFHRLTVADFVAERSAFALACAAAPATVASDAPAALP